MKYSSEKIAEVVEKTDLITLVSAYVNLKRVGAMYKGLCPFHNEKTPSFVVNTQKNIFHCFGCSTGGDAIKFLMLISNKTFPEAVEDLALQAGVELPKWVASGNYKEEKNNKEEVYIVLNEAKNFFINNYKKNHLAQDYLKQRGLSQKIINDFELGLTLNNWQDLLNYLKKKKFEEKILFEAGLIKKSYKNNNYYDTFRNRLMIPIYDANNKISGFGGRLLVNEENVAKYLNSPETIVYKKNNILYGFNKARPFIRASRLVFIVEGYFDLISLAEYNVNEVVAVLGTALSQNHLNLLRGLADEIILLFDADEAGERAAARALPLVLNSDLEARVLLLPKGEDPDTFVKKYGSDALYKKALESVDILNFYCNRLKNIHPNTITGLSKMAMEAKEIISQVPNTIKSNLLKQKLSKMLNLEEHLFGDFKEFNINNSFQTNYFLKNKNLELNKKELKLTDRILELLIKYPETAEIILVKMDKYWPEENLEIFIKLKEQFGKDKTISAEKLLNLNIESDFSSLISKALIEEKKLEADEAINNALEYLEILKNRFRKEKLLVLQDKIEDAEKNSNFKEVFILLKEKKDLLSE